MCVNICFSWFVYLEPEKHLTLSITGAVWSSSGSIFDLPAWLMSSPECNVIPCLTLSPNFTPFFFIYNSWSTCRCSTCTSHTHKRFFLCSIFVSLRLDINTNTEPPWQVSLSNQCSPEAMATEGRWEIRRMTVVGLNSPTGQCIPVSDLRCILDQHSLTWCLCDQISDWGTLLPSHYLTNEPSLCCGRLWALIRLW